LVRRRTTLMWTAIVVELLCYAKTFGFNFLEKWCELILTWPEARHVSCELQQGSHIQPYILLPFQNVGRFVMSEILFLYLNQPWNMSLYYVCLEFDIGLFYKLNQNKRSLTYKKIKMACVFLGWRGWKQRNQYRKGSPDTVL